jgi:hypothetical protein
VGASCQQIREGGKLRCVGASCQPVGIRRIGNHRDEKSIHCETPKSETPTRGKVVVMGTLVTWTKDLAREAKAAEERVGNRGSVNQVVGTSRVSKPR